MKPIIVFDFDWTIRHPTSYGSKNGEYTYLEESLAAIKKYLPYYQVNVYIPFPPEMSTTGHWSFPKPKSRARYKEHCTIEMNRFGFPVDKLIFPDKPTKAAIKIFDDAMYDEVMDRIEKGEKLNSLQFPEPMDLLNEAYEKGRISEDEFKENYKPRIRKDGYQEIAKYLSEIGSKRGCTESSLKQKHEEWDVPIYKEEVDGRNRVHAFSDELDTYVALQ